MEIERRTGARAEGTTGTEVRATFTEAGKLEIGMEVAEIVTLMTLVMLFGRV